VVPAAGRDDRRQHRAPVVLVEHHERDGTSRAWVSWIQPGGTRPVHKVVSVTAGSLAPVEAPDAYAGVPRRVLRADGSISELRPS